MLLTCLLGSSKLLPLWMEENRLKIGLLFNSNATRIHPSIQLGCYLLSYLLRCKQGICVLFVQSFPKQVRISRNFIQYKTLIHQTQYETPRNICQEKMEGLDGGRTGHSLSQVTGTC